MTLDDTLAKPLLLTDALQCELHHVYLAAGEAVVASFRAPDKTGSNEDAAAIVPCSSTTAILAVADGVGGSRLAHTASGAAVSAIAEMATRAGEGNLRAGLINAIEQANDTIIASGNGSATTLAAVELDEHVARPVHVGDSVVLVIGQRGRVRLETVAHSPVGYAVEAGVIDAGEAMHHEDRHLVSNVIGANDMRIEIGQRITLARRDTLVLATDGVIDNLHAEELVDLVRTGPLPRAASRVMDKVLERMLDPGAGTPCKPDDTTLILYRRNR